MKILVSDMGGVLYSYDKNFDPKAHDREFLRVMKIFGKEKAPVLGQMEGEWQGISTGLLKIVQNRKAIDRLNKNLKNYELVIVSTSLVKTSRFIIQRLGISFSNILIFNMSDYGGKKDKEAWKKIFRQLPSVDVIVEDRKDQLKLAGMAAKELGFSPQLFTQMPQL